MIRGLAGVIPHHLMEVGRFYFTPGGEEGPWLFQCVQTDEPFEGSFRRKALFLTAGGKPDIDLRDLPYHSPVVALDDIHVRVDCTSLTGSAFTVRMAPNVFLLDGEAPILCAQQGLRGWKTVNLTTGRTVDSGSVSHDWLSFTRWSLVMDDRADKELTIANFGEQGIRQD